MTNFRPDFFVLNLTADYIQLFECISSVYVVIFKCKAKRDVLPCKSILLITVKQEVNYWLKSERHGKAEDKKPMPSRGVITIIFQ